MSEQKQKLHDIASTCKIPIIYATQTNTTKQLALSLSDALTAANIQNVVIDVSKLQPTDMQSEIFIYMTCTYFQGEHPKNAVQFITELRSIDPKWESCIKNKYFAVFGLGSSKFKLFCKASEEADGLFEKCGGKRIVKAAKVDRNNQEGHEQEYKIWQQELISHLTNKTVVQTQSQETEKPKSEAFQLPANINHDVAVVDPLMCTGCQGCKDCPVGAISYVNNKCVVNHDTCIACGQCESVCSYNAIKVVRATQEDEKSQNSVEHEEQAKQGGKMYPLLLKEAQKFVQLVKGSSEPIPIIYATQTQTCKQLATQLARYLQLGQIKATVIDVANLKPSDLQASTFVYLTCTFFMGDHPKSALPFVSALRNKDPQWVNAIKDKYYSVFGIGSMKYKLFCKASDEIDELFKSHGGIKLMKPSKIDRNVPEGYEPHFQQWMKDLLDNFGVGVIEDNSAIYETQMRSRYPYIQPPKSYFWARLVERKQLSDNVVDGIQHYYKFELPANHTYKAGQHIAIMPRNHRQIMNELFKNRIIYLDDKCTMVAEPEFHVKMNVLQTEGSNLPLSNDFYSVWDLIAQYTDLHAMVNQNVLSLLANYATKDDQKKELKLLGDTKNQEAFQEKFTKQSTMISDIFRIYSSIRIPLHRFLEVVPPMSHRLYSIASSPKLIGAQSLELIITDVEWSGVDPKTGAAKKQKGLCTGFLYELSGFLGSYQSTYFDRMGMFPAQIHESPLEPPSDPMLPLIAIALGSGYAPFRSILQERLALHQTGVKLGPMCMFLGIRRRADYGQMLEELNTWSKEGIANTYLAISREAETPADHGDIPMTKEKRPKTVKITYGGHVTKSITDNYEVFGEHMTSPNNLILYCGKAGKIPEDLTETIIKALGKYGINEQESRKMWVQYLENGRIFFEAW